MTEIVMGIRRSGFADGLGRIFDFGNKLSRYSTHATPLEADNAAILSDWRAVGGDLRRAMHQADEDCRTRV